MSDDEASEQEPEKSPAEQLVDLFVYAPVGLLYDGEKVLDQLVTKGKSQVQLMKLMGQMAATKGKAEADDSIGDAFTSAALALAKGLSDFGAAVGLVPSPEAPSAPTPQSEDSTVEGSTVQGSTVEGSTVEGSTVEDGADQVISGYDDLTAREIIGQLTDLDDRQLRVVRDHEMANRSRKTVLAKIDQLS